MILLATCTTLYIFW